MDSLIILHGGETGNAEEVAYCLAKQLPGVSNLHSIASCDVTKLSTQSVVIFVVSTTGDGEFPAPMLSFWSYLLRKSLPSDFLSHLQFAVFGLGDSSYEKFNAAARKLFVRLKQLGATPIVDINDSLGDDQATAGYMATFDTWLSKIQDSLHANTLTSIAKFSSVVAEQSYIVHAVQFPFDSLLPPPITSNDSTLYGKVVNIARMTNPAWPQDVRHISISCEGLTYQPGDVAMIHYRNPHTLAHKATLLLLRCHADWTTDTPLQIQVQGDNKRPTRITNDIDVITIYQLCLTILDLGSIPKRSFFAGLAAYCQNSEEKDKLLELASSSLYIDYCQRERRNYVEVIEDFPSVLIPLQEVLKLIPKIVPRPYSIASSPLSVANQLELCVAVTTHRTPYGRLRQGLCSSFIASLQVGDQVMLSTRAGQFRHIADSLVGTNNWKSAVGAMILVGPGTGIAPMRSFLTHRLQLAPQSASSSSLPQNHLFYGCRRQGQDDLYMDEWSAIFSSHAEHTHIHIAYSQQVHQLQKVYVTHLIDQQASQLWPLLQEDSTIILVAGSAKRMPKDVKNALKKVIIAQGGLDEGQADAMLLRIIRAKRLVVEAWG